MICRRHWFSSYGYVGDVQAWCQRCGAPRPRCPHHERVLVIRAGDPITTTRYACGCTFTRTPR